MSQPTTNTPDGARRLESEQERPLSLDQALAHLPQLVLSGHAHSKVHGSGGVGRFNTWIAVKLTGMVGTMWCAYLFAGLALVALPQAIQSHSATVLVNWASSNFAQLVLLPLIMVGQNVLQAASDQRSLADHKTLLALKTINEAQLKILEELRKLSPAGG